MALRFRKSIKLAPGVRLNMSGSGFSWTLGPRGASVGIGKRGTYFNGNLPGGFSFREQLSGGSGRRAPAPTRSLEHSTPARPTMVSLTCSVTDDGTLQFLDASGQPASEALIDQAKRQKREELLRLIQSACDRVNDQVEALGRLHLDTPDPRAPPAFEPIAYVQPEPTPPELRAPRFLERVLPFLRRRLEAENARQEAEFRGVLDKWTVGLKKHRAEQQARRRFIEHEILVDPECMERFLEERLSEIIWPRETAVSVDLAGGGRAVQLDVDLPEIEDIPDKVASVPARGLKLSLKDMPAKKVERLYADHLHSLLFRLVGEVFAALPTCESVFASGFSQRADPSTGRVSDEYLLSVKVGRSEWMQIDFNNLEALDPCEALSRFDLRREMLKSGRLKAVTPHVIG